MPQEVILLFTSMLIMLACSFYSYAYTSDLNVRKTNEFKKAASYLPDVYPNTGVSFSPGTGIIMMRLAWYTIKKKEKTSADKRFIFSQILGAISSIVFIALFIVVWNH